MYIISKLEGKWIGLEIDSAGDEAVRIDTIVKKGDAVIIIDKLEDLYLFGFDFLIEMVSKKEKPLKELEEKIIKLFKKKKRGILKDNTIPKISGSDGWEWLAIRTAIEVMTKTMIDKTCQQ